MEDFAAGDVRPVVEDVGEEVRRGAWEMSVSDRSQRKSREDDAVVRMNQYGIECIPEGGMDAPFTG